MEERVCGGGNVWRRVCGRVSVEEGVFGGGSLWWRGVVRCSYIVHIKRRWRT